MADAAERIAETYRILRQDHGLTLSDWSTLQTDNLDPERLLAVLYPPMDGVAPEAFVKPGLDLKTAYSVAHHIWDLLDRFRDGDPTAFCSYDPNRDSPVAVVRDLEG